MTNSLQVTSNLDALYMFSIFYYQLDCTMYNLMCSKCSVVKLILLFKL